MVSIAIEKDYDNSSDKKIKYKVLKNGYLIQKNLSHIEAKELQKLIFKLRNKFGVKSISSY